MYSQDVETLEVVVAQLDECRSLIERDSVTALRMALILADNVAEVIMANKIENMLPFNPIYENYVRTVEQYPSAFDEEEQVNEARSKYIDKKTRREIERDFGKKVYFLTDRGFIDPPVAASLHKLHKYRSEAYHQGRVREGNLPQAVRIYFDLDCALLEDFDKPSPIVGKLWGLQELMESMPTVMRYSAAESKELRFAVNPSPSAVARSLSFTVQLDLVTLREDLAIYLRSQVDQIDSEMDFCLEYGHFLFANWKNADMIPMAYVLKDMETGGRALSLEEMRGKQFPTKCADLDRWRTEASQLTDICERATLFANFARIENELDPCRDSLRELASEVDRAYEHRMDLIRGK